MQKVKLNKDLIVAILIAGGYSFSKEDPADNGSHYDLYQKEDWPDVWVGGAFIESEVRGTMFNYRDQTCTLKQLLKFLDLK